MTNQILWAVVVGFHVVVAVAAGGCQPSLGVVCGRGWCSNDEICVGPQSAEPVCVRRSCGNGPVEQGEECDDGNNTGGDGCSPNCIREICGNRVQELGEACDDGNAWGGDGCSDRCTVEACGNGILDRDAGEQCDDENTEDGDGCTAICKLPSCGNGAVDPYEQCDDGDTRDGDGCSSSCTIEKCGNRILDRAAREQCDDENTLDGDGCTAICKLPLCGNGVVDPYEQCDEGDTRDGDGCSSSCTIEVCGNGILDREAGEQCDDRNAINGDGCEADCSLPWCGNRIVDHYEQCDDGNLISGDGCSSSCTDEVCGNRILDLSEQCDDGNRDSGDGCSFECIFERLGCGNGITAGSEACDDGNTENGDGCDNNCTFSRCGNGVKTGSEACDDDNQTSGDGCSATCVIEFCGDNTDNNTDEDCDTAGDSETCNADCTMATCGDGKINHNFRTDTTHTEQCDDRNTNNNDGCSSTCQFEFCGDGIANRGTEVCDTAGNSQECNADCTVPSCGDHKLNPSFTPPDGAEPEQCDDGNNNDGDGCAQTCQFERCGNDVIDPGEQCDGSPVDGFACSACHLVRCGDGVLDAGFGEQCDDGNAIRTDDCISDNPLPNTCKVAICGDGIRNNAREECDSGEPDDTCSSSCHEIRCGNGRLDPGEQCDDNNLSDGDGCSATCRVDFCGDGITNNVTEDCDAAGESPTCDADCTVPVCGDLEINRMFIPPESADPEQCDDGNTATGDGCGPTCQFERCGNDVIDPGEQCDGSPVGGFDCSSCRLVMCGDGVLDSSFGEECDDGNAVQFDDCISDDPEPSLCRFARCGDAIRNTAREECDNGALNGAPGNACSSSCQVVRCGNGTLDPDEQCDDNNQIDGDGCSAACWVELCGDNVVNNVDEECDTAGESPTCDDDCTVPVCGDLNVNRTFTPPDGAVPEQCDDGNATSGDGCSDLCTFEQPGIGLLAYIKASNTGASDVFGSSVALSADGSTLAVGARNEPSNAMGVGGDEANSSAPFAGAVYVFTRSGATWIQQAYVKASNTGAGDEFGVSVALSADGSTLAVGAQSESSADTGIDGNQENNLAPQAGAVYVFTRSGATWTQQAYIKASNTDTGDQFGQSVALSANGSTLAVGVRQEDSDATGIDGNQASNFAGEAGAVYVFTRSGATWSQQAYIKASNTGASDHFGASVGLSDDGSTLAVGSQNEASDAIGIDGEQTNDLAPASGAVYVFTRSGATWIQQTYIKASNTEAGDNFGENVALSGDGSTLAVGARFEASRATGIDGNQEDNSVIGAGAVYVFARSGATWGQQAYIKASNTEEDHFSWSIALSADGSTLAVGAWLEDSAATLVGGNQADNSVSSAGAVYLFTRSGLTWSQQAYIKASNTDNGDEFGWSVALSGDGSTLAAGAILEDSAATGIGGNQADNSAGAAGAVYVFY
jgi:cysteine-rich repeat protein